MSTITEKHPKREAGSRSRCRRVATGCAMLLISLLVVIVPVAPANAATRCPAFVTWQDWIGGARVHAYVDFRPSDTCNGRHVKKAYVRIIRTCGPYLDSGRRYTYTASSPRDTRLFSVSAWMFDSVLWGCRTNTYYDFEYF